MKELYLSYNEAYKIMKDFIETHAEDDMEKEYMFGVLEFLD